MLTVTRSMPKNTVFRLAQEPYGSRGPEYGTFATFLTKQRLNCTAHTDICYKICIKYSMNSPLPIVIRVPVPGSESFWLNSGLVNRSPVRQGTVRYAVLYTSTQKQRYFSLKSQTLFLFTKSLLLVTIDRHIFVLWKLVNIEGFSSKLWPNSQSLNQGIKSTLALGCRTGPPSFIGWRAGMTTLCHSRLYPPVRN